jgi:hypothetical protein
MRSFHFVFVDALRCTTGITDEEVDGAFSDISETELLLPSSHSGAYRKEERRRNIKGVRWLEDIRSLFKLMLFVHIAVAVMEVHWALFKHAQESGYGDDMSYIFNLCDMSNSKALQVLSKLAHLMLQEDGWGVMTGRFGPFVAWPPEYKCLARECVVMLYLQVWRRLVACFTESPWWLVPLANPDTAIATKQAIADRLFAAPEATLDLAAQKIRRRAGDAATLQTRYWLRFLFHSFNKVVTSTAFIECTFAAFTQWIRVVPKPLGLALVQGKHVCSGMKRSTDSIQARCKVEGEPPLKKAKLARPDWIVKRGEASCRNARHEFIGQYVADRPIGQQQDIAFKGATGAWKIADHGVKASCKAKAKASNMLVKQRKFLALTSASLQESGGRSTWNAGFGSIEFPLGLDHIDSKMRRRNGVKMEAAAFRLGATRTAESEDFPSVVHYTVPVAQSMAGLEHDQREWANEVLDTLKILLVHRGSDKLCVRKHTEPIIITAANDKCIVVVCGHRHKTSPFSAEFVIYPLGEDREIWGDLPPIPFVVSLIGDCSVYAIGKPLVRPYNEKDLAVTVISTSTGPWTFRHATIDNAGCESLHAVCVAHVSEVIDMEAERQKSLDTARLCAAYRLFKASRRPWYMVRPRGKQRTDKLIAKGQSKKDIAGKEDMFDAKKTINESDESSDRSDCGPALAFKQFVDADNKKALRQSLRRKLQLHDDDDESDDDESHHQSLEESHHSAAVIGGIASPAAVIGGIASASPAAVIGGIASSVIGGIPPQKLDEYPITHLGTYIGIIKIDRRRQQFNAHCIQLGLPDHEKDHRMPKTPECRINRKALKAPLGLLVAWLRISHCFDGRKDHST